MLNAEVKIHSVIFSSTVKLAIFTGELYELLRLNKDSSSKWRDAKIHSSFRIIKKQRM